jgi:hypothetical protein
VFEDGSHYPRPARRSTTRRSPPFSPTVILRDRSAAKGVEGPAAAFAFAFAFAFVFVFAFVNDREEQR